MDSIIDNNCDYDGMKDEDQEDEYADEDDDQRRRVDFALSDDQTDEGSGNKTNRLHRRDTPHHLKNKRIHTPVDKDKVASIIAQVRIHPVTKVNHHII